MRTPTCTRFLLIYAHIALLAACGDAEADVAADAGDVAADVGESDASTNGTVGEGNTAPTLAAVGNRSFAAGQLNRVVLAASDAQGDAITFIARGAPAGSRFDKVSGVFEWQPAIDDVGRLVAMTFAAADEAGAEDREFIEIAVVEALDQTAPQIAEGGAVVWPVGRPHAWAVPASDADGDALVFALGAAAPEGMVLGETSGILEWSAPDELIGQTLLIDISVTDDDGLSDAASIRLALGGLSRETLPPVSVVAGEAAELDLVPEGVNDGLVCTVAPISAALPGGATLEDCVLRWPVPAAAEAATYALAFDLDDPSTASTPDVERLVELTVVRPDECAGADVLDLAPLEVVEFDTPEILEFSVCSSQSELAAEVTVEIPERSTRLTVDVDHASPDVVDFDLLVDCGASARELSDGVTGVERVSLDVEGASACSIAIYSYGPVPSPTALAVEVALFGGGVDPRCAPDAVDPTLYAGDTLEQYLCPGAPRRWELGVGIASVTTVSDAGDLDLTLSAVDSVGAERLVAEAIATGDTETIGVDATLLAADEYFVLDVVPWEVPPDGTTYLIAGDE